MEEIVFKASASKSEVSQISPRALTKGAPMMPASLFTGLSLRKMRYFPFASKAPMVFPAKALAT